MKRPLILCFFVRKMDGVLYRKQGISSTAQSNTFNHIVFLPEHLIANKHPQICARSWHMGTSVCMIVSNPFNITCLVKLRGI